MRETDFIRQNKDKWQRYEYALDKDEQDPDLLSELYIRTTDDLSYSQTFYKNRSVRLYLNDLARRTFLKVYKGRRGESGRFVTFWTDELPRILFHNRRILLLSLVIFVASMIIGAVSYAINPEFAELILSKEYLRRTLENIASGDPMAIYKSEDAFGMFLRITFNNIQVALLAFALGAFAAIGTVVLLISNGIMLGVFQAFFLDQGLFWDSFTTIYIHGAIEISSIVIAGAAGMLMGSGLLFPGTLTRRQAFAQSARDGVKIMLSLIPLFIIAGFLESYLTRHYQEISIVLRGLFIVACFAFILWYYVAYPAQVVKRNPHATRYDRRHVTRGQDEPIRLHAIKMLGEVYSNVFSWLLKRLSYVIGGIIVLAGLFAFLAFYFSGAEAAYRYTFASSSLAMFYNFHVLLATIGYLREPTYFLLVFGLVLSVQYLVYAGMEQILNMSIDGPVWRAVLRLVAPSLCIALAFSFSNEWLVILSWLLLPLLLNWSFAAYFQLAGFGRATRYLFSNLIKSYALAFLLVLFSFIISLFFDTVVSRVIFSALNWVFSPDFAQIDDYNAIILTVLYLLYFNTIMVLLCAGMGINYLSLREKEEAHGLLMEIETIGQEKRIRGMVME